MTSPAAPTVTSISVTQTGTTLTATVGYTDGTSAVTQSFTGMATDSVTSLTGALTVNFTAVVPDATTVTAADSANRTWTKQSDNGSTAVFTAPA